MLLASQQEVGSNADGVTLAVMLMAQQDVGSHADGVAAGRWQ